MVTEINATGKTVNEAIDALKEKLGVSDLDGIDWKVVSVGKKGGLFGLGAQPAKVVAFIEAKQEPKSAAKPEVKPEAKSGTKPETKPEAKPAERPARAEGRPERAPRENRPEKAERPEKKEARPAKPRAEKAPAPQSEPKPKKPKTPTTEAELKAAVSFVETLIKNLEIEVEATVGTDADNASCITIDGKDASVLIGHHGETLDALQYLANLAANRAEGKDDHERITVDVANYRARREEKLRELARRQAEKVQKYGRSVMLEPMNPYERRIIHSEIQNIEGVSTNSIGSDSNRKVVIFLTEKGMGRLPRPNDRRRGGNDRRDGGRRVRRDRAPRENTPVTENTAETAAVETAPVAAAAPTATDAE